MIANNFSIKDLNFDNNGGEDEPIEPTKDEESFKDQEIRKFKPNPTYFIDASFKDTEIDIGTIRIKIDTCYSTSMISKQLANFLKPQCFRSEQPNMASVRMSIRSPHWQGNFTTEWEFKISEDLQDDPILSECILGADFFSNNEKSPINNVEHEEGLMIIKLKNGIIHQVLTFCSRN